MMWIGFKVSCSSAVGQNPKNEEGTAFIKIPQQAGGPHGSGSATLPHHRRRAPSGEGPARPGPSYGPS